MLRPTGTLESGLIGLSFMALDRAMQTLDDGSPWRLLNTVSRRKVVCMCIDRCYMNSCFPRPLGARQSFFHPETLLSLKTTRGMSLYLEICTLCLLHNRPEWESYLSIAMRASTWTTAVIETPSKSSLAYMPRSNSSPDLILLGSGTASYRDRRFS